MAETVEAKLKSLEAAIGHLQGIEEEHYEELNNTFSNRIESQLNLLRHLMKQAQTLKLFTKATVRKAGLTDETIDKLWEEAKAAANTDRAEEEMVAEYSKELRKEDDRD